MTEGRDREREREREREKEREREWEKEKETQTDRWIGRVRGTETVSGRKGCAINKRV